MAGHGQPEEDILLEGQRRTKNHRIRPLEDVSTEECEHRTGRTSILTETMKWVVLRAKSLMLDHLNELAQSLQMLFPRDTIVPESLIGMSCIINRCLKAIENFGRCFQPL